MREAEPTSVERLRSGWALIGYDLPLRRGKRYFAFIAPERRHVHLGFEYGAWMADPDGLLEGANIKLKKVRFVTFEPAATLDRTRLIGLVQQAAEVACMTPGERLARML